MAHFIGQSFNFPRRNGLRILGHAMAYAGNWDHPSHLHKGTQVKMCPLGVNIEYADEALRYAMLWD